MSYSREQLLKMEPLKVYTLILNGEIERFPKGYFLQKDIVTKEKCAKVMKHFFKKVLKWNEKKICENLCTYTFYDNGLSTMFVNVFESSVWKVVEATYPGKFKPWQFGSVPNNYWNEERAGEAIRWLIEEKLHWTDEEVCKNICQKTFFDNNLTYPFLKLYNSNLCKALNSAYPGKYVKKSGKITLAV